jgi:uncharacterized protein YycO
MPIPLDPGAGGRSIGARALQIADIIVSTHADEITSRIIRTVTSSPVSHTSLYVGGGLVVEAIKEGVVQRSLTAAFAGASLAVAYRRPELPDTDALAIRDYAGRQIGKPYNFAGLPGVAGSILGLPHGMSGWIEARLPPLPLRKPRRQEDSFFCSELVLAAYQTQGARLTIGEPRWGTPQDITALRLDRTLIYVGHLKASNE